MLRLDFFVIQHTGVCPFRQGCSFHLSRGVATSQTTPYNPCWNDRVERYNGIIWKVIAQDLCTKNIPSSSWETSVLSNLNSTRILISTLTNETPHERFLIFQRRFGQGTTLPMRSWPLLDPYISATSIKPARITPSWMRLSYYTTTPHTHGLRNQTVEKHPSHSET